MKKLLIIPIIIFFAACKKHKVEKNCCSQSRVELRIDSASVICPNIFTPNGNGVNDLFLCQAKNLSSISIKVYNKKDEVIDDESIQAPGLYAGTWTGKHAAGKWNGQTIEGDYKFVIDAVSISGKNLHGEGSISVITDPSKYCLDNMGTCKFPDGTKGTLEHFKCN